jgi:Ca-activated chloride channel family protein
MDSSFRSAARVNNHGITCWVLLAVLVSFHVGASGQSTLEDVHVTPRTPLINAAEPARDSAAVPALIKKDVDLVLVPVTVTDSMERLVTGLSQDNFEVFDNKKPQQIKHFSSEDSPVSLGLIVDTSGSMTSKMDRVREAVQQLCTVSNPQDEFFVIMFSDEPRLVDDFTDSTGEIQDRFLYAVPKGRTALLDAIYMGIRKMKQAKYSKKALLIISDGGDNHSRYTEGEVKSAAQESDVMIYAIGTVDRYVPTPEEAEGPQLLSNIAEMTGGRAFILDKEIEMPDVARRIGIELRTQYVLGYTPEHPPHDGKWHKISVKLRLPKHLPFMQAKAKTGYYASNE